MNVPSRGSSGAGEIEGCARNPTATIALQVFGLSQPPSPGEAGDTFPPSQVKDDASERLVFLPLYVIQI